MKPNRGDSYPAFMGQNLPTGGDDILALSHRKIADEAGFQVNAFFVHSQKRTDLAKLQVEENPCFHHSPPLFVP